ncbi:hypothetical protein, partial [Massilia sp. X63]|uniref:hypothetical protein n=1 Tax=Massilia sp. X63 TaxID=3237285 RepID=UPI0034DD0639
MNTKVRQETLRLFLRRMCGFFYDMTARGSGWIPIVRVHAHGGMGRRCPPSLWMRFELLSCFMVEHWSPPPGNEHACASVQEVVC